MEITVHSFSRRVKVETDDIVAYVWSIELDKPELVIKGASKPLPIDEELYELEEKFIMKKQRKA